MHFLATDLRKLAAVDLVSFVAEPRTTKFLALGRVWCQPVRRHPYQWIWPCSGHFPFTDAAATPIHSRRSRVQFGALLCGFTRCWKWMGNSHRAQSRTVSYMNLCLPSYLWMFHPVRTQSGRGVKVNTCFYPVSKWRMNRALPPFPHTPSLRIQELPILCSSYVIEDPMRAVGWGTALQAGGSRFRFSKVSSEFFINIILPAAVWPWGRLSFYQKWVPGIFPGG
jgi:hypothetical protein